MAQCACGFIEAGIEPRPKIAVIPIWHASSTFSAIRPIYTSCRQPAAARVYQPLPGFLACPYSISASSGLNAAQWGLTTTGQNISNAATPGYTQETPRVQERIGAVHRRRVTWAKASDRHRHASYSEFLTTQVNNAQSNSSSLNTYYSMLSQLNNLVGDPTKGIAQGITNYFSGMQSVAKVPRAARRAPIADEQRADARGPDERRPASNLRPASLRASTALKSAVSQINSYSKQIAELNEQIDMRERGRAAAEPVARSARSSRSRT